MKLVCVMPIWKRPTLTSLILRQWHRQIHRLRDRVDVHVVCVGSEGRTSARLMEGFSDVMSYVEARNDALNLKWNAGLGVARYLDPDAVLTIGSDDLVSDSLLVRYAELVADGLDFFGLTDLYFFDSVRVRLGYWPGYGPTRQPHRIGEPIGAARCHSRRVLETLQWELWSATPTRNCAMDHASLLWLAEHGFRPTAYSLDALGVKAVDIKADESITGFERIPYARVEQGAAAVAYLRDLLDEDSLQQLVTHWRIAA